MAVDGVAPDSTIAIARALALTTRAVDLLDAHGGYRPAAVLVDLARRELCEVLAAAQGGLDDLWSVRIGLGVDE